MAQRIRTRCPHCGMMTFPKNIKEGPYKPKVFLQTFGGKVKGEGKGRGAGSGSTSGMIEYEDITNTPEGRRVLNEIGEVSS